MLSFNQKLSKVLSLLEMAQLGQKIVDLPERKKILGYSIYAGRSPKVARVVDSTFGAYIENPDRSEAEKEVKEYIAYCWNLHKTVSPDRLRYDNRGPLNPKWDPASSGRPSWHPKRTMPNYFRNDAYKDIFNVESLEDFIDSIRLEPVYEIGAFNVADLKAIKNPVTWRKIEEFLNGNPAGYIWNFIVVRDDDRLNSDYPLGVQQKMGIHVGDYVKNLYPDIDYDNSITFVKTSSSGDALDANMILHTAAHAVMGLPANGRILENIKETINAYDMDLRDQVDSLSVQQKSSVYDLEKLARIVGARPDNSRYSAPVFVFPRGEMPIILFSTFCHFNAAKNTLIALDKTAGSARKKYAESRRLLDMDEMVYEMLSVYIKRNRVKIAPNEYCFIIDAYWINKAVEIGDYINEQFKICLDNCVGEVITDGGDNTDDS